MGLSLALKEKKELLRRMEELPNRTMAADAEAAIAEIEAALAAEFPEMVK